MGDCREEEYRHTCGSWSIEDEGTESGTRFKIRDDLGHVICEIACPAVNGIPESLANARAISAIPFLVGACDMLVRYYLGHEAGGDFAAKDAGSGVHRALIFARKALAMMGHPSGYVATGGNDPQCE